MNELYACYVSESRSLYVRKWVFIICLLLTSHITFRDALSAKLPISTCWVKHSSQQRECKFLTICCGLLYSCLCIACLNSIPILEFSLIESLFLYGRISCLDSLNLENRAVLTAIYFKSISSTLIFECSSTSVFMIALLGLVLQVTELCAFIICYIALIALFDVLASTKSNLDWTRYIKLDCIP